MNIWLNFLIDSMAFGATFIYGSTGEILTEKAGHLNLGIPGIMCRGGAGGCLVLNAIGRSSLPPFLIVILGILGSLALAMLCGMIYSFLTVTLRANQNVTGLALTTFGVGLMKVIMSKLDATVYLVGPKQMYRWPFANRQDSLQAMGILFFAAVIIAVLAGWILFRTKTGLHLRAVGENPATADAVGINVTKYKYAATCIGSGIAG
ncbi:MAG: ABC transporter permease, partial [Clostridia bacterium]|nr:ABC transporter permease [Clostridia bacterium]